MLLYTVHVLYWLKIIFIASQQLLLIVYWSFSMAEEEKDDFAQLGYPLK